MTTDFVLDALSQALHARQREQQKSLIHHSDGSVGDSYEHEACPWGTTPWPRRSSVCTRPEIIHRRSWSNREHVELATLERVHWFNHQRLREPIENIPPVEAEQAYYRRQAGQAMVA